MSDKAQLALGSGMAMGGLRTEQAPPLSVPLTFFLTAPLAIALAGLLLLSDGAALFATRWMPHTMALVHLGTLGFVGMVMLGALYQMIPVVAGAPVPAVRIAHGVHAALVAGLAALVWGFDSGRPAAFWLAAAALGTAFVAFLVPVAIALWRAPSRHDAVWGIRLAVAALCGLVALGITMAYGRASGGLAGDWIAWLTTHVALGAVGWIGGLLTGVSYQLVPMFYLAEPPPSWARRSTLAAVALAIVGPLAALALGRSARQVALTAAPGAVAIWLLHPLITVWRLRQRRRRRRDASLHFWQAGLAAGPPTLALATAAVLLDHPRWVTAFGWLLLWGWAGTIVHGVLTRIVPFLVWFHRFAGLIGKAPVPPMRRMLPDRAARVGLLLHVATLLIGAAALVGGSDLLARAAGGGLIATAAALELNLVRVLRYASPESSAIGTVSSSPKARS